MNNSLPSHGETETTYRVVYAVHRVLESMGNSVEGEPLPVEQREKPTDFIGMVTVKSVNTGSDALRSLALPEDLVLPAATATTTLVVEVAYSFLPKAWGKGYATESVEAVFELCRRVRSFWTPFSKLYVRAIVDEDNPASMRVMDKTGMTKRGVYEWTGKAIFIGGEWRERNSLHIYGMYLLE